MYIYLSVQIGVNWLGTMHFIFDDECVQHFDQYSALTSYVLHNPQCRG